MSLERQLISPQAEKKSSILALTLWALCLLSLLGLYLGTGVRQKMSLVKRLTTGDSLYYIADVGVKAAIFELLQDETAQDFLSERWSNNPDVFKDIRVGAGRCNVYYEFLNRDGLRRQRFGIVDEESKININKAELPVIERLIREVLNYDETGSQELAASIVDWRDSDSFLSIPIGSAEDSYYQNLKQPYDCKDFKFQEFRELLLVKGMDEEIFEKLRGFITIFGEGSVNINTAQRQVFSALGIADELLEKIFLYRAGKDEKEDTKDDQIFDIPSNIVAQLSQYVSLSVDEVASLSNIVSRGLLTTYSYNFMVNSYAAMGGVRLTGLGTQPAAGEESEAAAVGRGSVKQITCVVNRKAQILYWHEN